MEHHESPIARTNPSGKRVFIARYTGSDGRRRSAGTFRLKRDAQNAIDDAYAQPHHDPQTVAAYLEVWLRRYPRADRTNRTNESRIRNVLGLEVEGVELGAWALRDLRRKHALELVDGMLRVQGRAVSGAQNILRVLSAMMEDAITDELAGSNAFRGVRVRAGDQRAEKDARPVRVFDWGDMHRFAAASPHEPMVRALCDCGLRVGELFALRRRNLNPGTPAMTVEGSAWEGAVTGSTREKNHARTIPVPDGLAAILRGMPPRIDTEWLFPTKTGKLWRINNFYRDVWRPAQRATGLDMRPHEARHSYVSLMRAAGVDDADLAAITGHGLATMVGRYAHSLGRSDDLIRKVVG